jgi:predicted permease
VLATSGLLIALLLVGRLLAALGLVGERGANRLNHVAIAALFPAVILRQAPGLELDPALLLVPAIAWVLVGAGFVVGAVLRHGGLDVATATTVALGVSFGNTAFLGYTLVPALLGDDALPVAVVSDQLGSFIPLSPGGLLAISVAGGGPRPGPLAMLRRVILFPPFIALVVGITVMPEHPPPWLDAGLRLLGHALLPTMAVALGVRLRWRIPPTVRRPLAAVAVGKLVAAPAIALGLATLAGLPPPVRDVVVLQAGMPVMVTVAALLTFAGVAVELATAMVAVTTLASLLTLPAWAALLRTLA